MATRTRTRPAGGPRGSTRPREAPRPDAQTRERARSDMSDEMTAAAEAAEASQQGDTGSGSPADTGAAAGSAPAATPGRNPGRGRRATGGRIARGERLFDSAARDAGRLSLTPPRRLTARDGSGFLFGLLLYVLGLNYVRHGPEGVKGWLAAKFLNKPWTPPDPAADSRTDRRIKRHDPADATRTGAGGTARAPAARKPQG